MKCRRVCQTIVALGLLAAAAAVGWTGFKSLRAHLVLTSPERARAAGQPLPVSMVSVESGILDTLVGAQCTAQESARAVLASRLERRVVRVAVALGDAVVKGQILLELDSALSKAMLDNASQSEKVFESTLREMEEYLSNVRKAEAKAMIRMTELIDNIHQVAQVRLNLMRAKQELIQARDEIESSQISAPADGVVTALNVAVGTTLHPFDELISISRLDPIRLECAFSEDQRPALKDHDRLEVTFTAHPGRTFSAEFERLLPVVDEETRTLRVWITLPNPNREFLPGMQATVRLGKIVEGLRIPAIGLIRDNTRPEDDRASVFVVDANGAARLRAIRTGRYARGYIEVLDGLSRGERIVVAGQKSLQDGDRVREGGQAQSLRQALFPAGDH